MADRIGLQLGHYRLIRLLGRGGFAEVYLGEHLRLKTQVAVKILHTSLEDDDVEGFLREAQMVAHLKHPHIVRVFDFDVENHTPFLVMDYLPNGNVRRSYPKGSSLPQETIVSYVKQVASALQYAHDQKLIHRDIKPENMLLDRDNTIVLSDFGIALMAQSSRYQSTQEVAGTAAYMAPEQFQGHPHRASDQYELGVVIYEWLTGDRPFHGSFSEIASQHLFVPPPSLREKVPSISSEVEQVVLTALEKDQHKRFGSVQAFATALEQACLPKDSLSIVQSQPLLPSNVAFSPSQHIRPAITALASNQPLQSSILTPSTSGSQSSRHHISRRTIVLSLAGLAAAASGLTWLALSHSSTNSVPRFTSTAPAGRIASPSPTPTSPPLLGTTFYSYQAHSFNLRVLAWSPDGKRIASGGDDHTALVWDATNGSNVITYHGHSSYVEGVAWSPDNNRVASGSADGTVQIWNPTTGDLIYTYHGHNMWVNRVSWSPNGKYIASGDQSSVPGRVVTVRVWEADTGNTIVTYRGHINGVFAVAWSPNGTHVASCGYDGTLQVWEGITGNLTATYRGNTALFGLSWSPDSKQIAVGGNATTVWVLNANTGNVVSTYDVHSEQVPDVAWSPDGSRIAAGSHNQAVYVLNATTGKNLYTYANPSQSSHIDAITWSPNNQRIASGGNNGSVQVWQAV